MGRTTKGKSRIVSTIRYSVLIGSLAITSIPLANAADSFFTLTLLVGKGNSVVEKVGQVLAQDLEKIGIGVDLQYVEFASISPRYKLTSQTGKTFKDGGFDFYLTDSSLNAFPDPSGIYRRYASDQFYPDGNNRVRFVNDTFDKLIYESLNTPDDIPRWELAKKAIRVLREELSSIPLYRAAAVNIVRNDIVFPEDKSYFGWQSYAARWAERDVSGKSKEDMTPRERTLVIATRGSGLEAFLPGYHDNDDTERALNFVAFDALVTPKVGSFSVGDAGEKGPRPALADSWEVTNGGKTWTFHLNKDAAWHDGVKFTADDVMFTLDLILDPEAGYGSAKFIKTNGITWKKIDDNTVQINSEKFNPLFVSELLTIPVVPKHTLEKLEPSKIKTSIYNTTEIVGTGPFILDEYKANEHIRYKANENYYGGRPFFDYVVFKVIPTKTAAWYAIKAGEVDITGSYGFNRELPEVNEDPNMSAVFQPDIAAELIRINHDHPQLKKKNVRWAISYASNRQVMVDVINAGLAKVANQHVASWSPAYSDELPDLQYDLEEAKRRMVAAGFDYDTISIDGPK